MRNDETMDLFGDQIWQMSFGERAAIEGLLSARPPALAVEVGTAEGACLRRIARHAAEVHSFDLVLPSVPDLGDHVHLHTGDSHVLLGQVLEGFAAEGRNVDFALVDGDHSADGVRADVETLLASPAVGDTIIVTHDTGNEEVRRGLDAVAYDAFPKVAHVDLDFVPGHLGRDRFAGELWYGLGLIVVAADRAAYGAGPAVQTDRHHGGELLAMARDVLGGRYRRVEDAPVAPPAGAGDDQGARIAELEAQVAHHRRVVDAVTGSTSWKLTAPLRAAQSALRRGR